MKSLFDTSPEEPLSVSDYIQLLNDHIANLSAEIIGEISELKIPASGHVYPVLKDKKTGHILPCTIWKSDYILSGVELEPGMEVLVKGKPSFYGPFGKLSFNAKSVELVGEGALKKAYEKLRRKLTVEGIFEQSRKRPLPTFPKRIGVITSLHGAVIHDFSSNLRRSGFQVLILNSKVEGPESGRDLTLAVRAFKKKDVDVLVIMRGGGSMQSLAGFDNEALVREIASFPIPVIAGVGHHQDVPLAALAADVAESTPSFVAAQLNRSWEQAEYQLERSQDRILNSYERTLVNTKEQLSVVASTMRNVVDDIFTQYKEAKRAIHNTLYKMSIQIKRDTDAVYQSAHMIVKRFVRMLDSARSEYIVKIPLRLNTSYQGVLTSVSENMRNIIRLIEVNNPERQLGLGYSIITTGGHVVRTVKTVRLGIELTIKLFDGEVLSEVKKIQ